MHILHIEGNGVCFSNAKNLKFNIRSINGGTMALLMGTSQELDRVSFFWTGMDDGAIATIMERKSIQYWEPSINDDARELRFFQQLFDSNCQVKELKVNNGAIASDVASEITRKWALSQ